MQCYQIFFCVVWDHSCVKIKPKKIPYLSNQSLHNKTKNNPTKNHSIPSTIIPNHKKRREKKLVSQKGYTPSPLAILAARVSQKVSLLS